MKHPLRLRRPAAIAVVAIASVATLVVLPGTAESTVAANRLHVQIAATVQGPLRSCSSACGPDNTVWHFIYVGNENRLTNMNGGTSRATLPNAFVVSSVDWNISVDGVPYGGTTTWAPPPNAYLRGWSGHWPSTVTCPAPPDPCNVVGNPAVVPGERTAVLYAGWVHGESEPNGVYVFTYTVHGTLNGEPVDLTASAPPIQMTE
jgi:hypothetical protein